ncbi:MULTISPECIES: triose-phosphate isomerase [Burkholderiaceae]|uniref:triose-phosphate isomerase n=1 Tax=Burkholderiaceae TaxID=119060 RepID=UPI0009689D47|nr:MULTISPECIES: triose-phosphate isomerase [Burkholderiaceae]MCG1039879.1 triose-phosphate isomerase [Mycetohabitans sp. B7]SIT71440.1 triosephosphate isomerase [Burkholderia sp. b14]
MSKQQRSKLVVGNWKMHGRVADNDALLHALVQRVATLGPQVRLGVCVPHPYLAQVQARLAGTPIAYGAQDVSAHTQGAYTGEVAAPMVAEFGATLAIVGHSERRALHAESSEWVAAKTQRALEAGITPIVCVGETLDERQAGQTDSVVRAQLAAVLDVLDEADVARLIVAYEPVWAIGTGQSATAQQAQQVHAALRAQLTAKGGGQVPLLYGGSVKPGNAQELFSQADIDGGLIGGASLSATDFLAIGAAAAAALAGNPAHSR